MRGYVAALRLLAVAGFLVGAAAGAMHWSRSWPGLSLLSACKGAALGWLLGATLAIPFGCVWSRRLSVIRGRELISAPPNAPGRRAIALSVSALALAPVGLWLTIALPGGVLRKAMASGRAPGDGRPNLILITIEALRPDRIGAYGSAAGLTPNLDAFAREGTSYEAAYARASWTLPSLAALFTSLPPSQCAVNLPASRSGPGHQVSYLLAAGPPLLWEELGRAGYATAAELTNHFLSPERGWDRGFDCYRNESTEDIPISDLTLGQHVTERASDWLSLNRREPFFLWVHYFDPHVPYDAPDTPAALRARYPPEWMAHPRIWLDEMRFQREPTRTRYMDFYRMMYDQEVRYADRWVGELLSRIKATGRYENSLIVITADHGEELFDRTERGGVEHGHSMHEAVLWVPLLVKWPKGEKADARIGQTVSLSDLRATFLQFAGVRASATDRGQGLPARQPAGGQAGRQAGLPQRSGSRGEEVFTEWIYYGAEQTALITDDYKIIYDPGEEAAGGRFQVYDRRTDRQERHDLAGTPLAARQTFGGRLRLQQLTRAALETRRLTAARYGSRSLALSDKARRDLQSLGYIGDRPER